MPDRQPHRRRIDVYAMTLLVVMMGIRSANSRADETTESDAVKSPSRGVTWTDHRVLEQSLATLFSRDSENSLAMRLSILREMSELDPRTLVRDGETQVPLHQVLQRWVAALEGESREKYLGMFEMIASRDWKDAENGVLDQRIRSALRYPETATGGEAAYAIAAELIDRGRYAEAVAWCRRVREHRLTAAEDRRHAWLRQIICHLKLGSDDIRIAETLWREYQTFAGTMSPPVTRQGMLFTTWIEAEFARKNQQRQELAITLPERISREPVWQQRTVIFSDLQDILKDALSEYREQGWLDLPILQPLRLGERVVIPQLNRLVCYRVSDGDVLWQTPPETSLFEQGDESAKNLQNSGFRYMLAQTLVQQVQRDAMTATLSTNGKLIFAVREWPSESLASTNAAATGNNNGRDNGKASGSRFSRNRLLAYDLATGEQRWELRHLSKEHLSSLGITLDPEQNATGQDAELPSILFLGPPLAVLSEIYTVAQINSDLVLVAVDADGGQVNWAYHLASITADANNQSPRRGTRALLHHRGGMLYGATGRGLVFAFDLSGRSLMWGTVTARDDWNRQGTVQTTRFQRKSDDEWWIGWRDSYLGLTDSALIVATPDMDWVRSLDLASGELNWEFPRDDGLFVSEPTSDRMLIVDPRQVQAIRTDDGTVLWQQPIAAPAGRGCLLASHYLLPLQNRMWVKLSLSDGLSQTIDRLDPQPLGNVFVVPGGMLSLQHDHVAMFPDWQVSMAKVAAEREAAPDDLALLRRQGRLEFEADHFEAASSRWQEYLDRQSDANLLQSARREFLRELLTELEMHPDRLPHLRDELLSLGKQTHLESGVQLQIAAAHRRRGEADDSLTVLLKAAEESTTEKEIDDDISRRTIRWDRHVQGLILDLLTSAESEERQSLDRQLENAFIRSRDSADAFAPARFADRFKYLPQGQAMRLTTAKQWGVGARLHHVELALRDLSNHSDPSIASEALVELGEVLWEKSFRSDAVSSYRRLKDEFAGRSLASGQTTDQFVSKLTLPPRFAQELADGKPDVWATQPPQVSQMDENYSGSVDWVMIPVECDRYSLWNRVTLGVDRRGRTVRFHSPDEPEAWELKLPESTSMFRYVFPMHRGWGIGRMLVLQVGADIMGISPWNERGEPQAEVVWYLEGYPQQQPQLNDLGIRQVLPRVGIKEPMLEVLDQYGRIIGNFGPVGAGQFYLFRNGKLEACETATASLVWQRKMIKPYSHCQADAEYVFLHRPDQRELEILRGVDGKTIVVRTVPDDTTDILVMQGRFALKSEIAVNGEVSVGWYDLFADRYVWQHTAPAMTIPFTTDNESLGLLEADGTLKLLNLKKGTILSEQKVELPESISNVHCAATERQLVVAITGPMKDPAKLTETELRIDHRRPLINGRLLALDRVSGGLIWEREIGDSAFPLEQPRGVPVLVFNHWETRSDGTEQKKTVGVMKCLDLRTGDDIVQVEGESWGDHYAMTLRAEQGRLEFHSPNQTIRLTYAMGKEN
ncbi:MAG: PQQ-binding-like beta-propeller repeat protein [Planctomycetota bacterium]|nr:PQQ-binding-like beta-propeller repeat protein [Planctomycetota bacterium]